MKNGRNYWAEHVAAIKSQGVTASTYARRQGISVTALYYWQRKLQLEMAPHSMALATAKPQSKFVALRVNNALEQMAQPSWGCSLCQTYPKGTLMRNSPRCALARAASSMRALSTPSSNSLMLPFIPSSNRSLGRHGS